jgi:hypothetical protein
LQAWGGGGAAHGGGGGGEWRQPGQKTAVLTTEATPCFAVYMRIQIVNWLEALVAYCLQPCRIVHMCATTQHTDSTSLTRTLAPDKKQYSICSACCVAHLPRPAP